MLTAEENDILTQTDAETPMGEYFRRFWQPVALSEELPEPDSAPLRVTVMGENLVAFRDTEGRVGLMDRVCPHRGADMFFGRNEECGLRCVYHGWKFDVDGKAVDLPNVPPGVRHHETVLIKTYRPKSSARSSGLYGAQGRKYAGSPPMEFGLMPERKCYVMKQMLECNWAQAMEGDLDTSHFRFCICRHPTSRRPKIGMPIPRIATSNGCRDGRPKFDILDHDVGFVVGGARATDEEGELYWRMTQFMLPSHGTGPATVPGETYYGFTLVPIDDPRAGCIAMHGIRNATFMRPNSKSSSKGTALSPRSARTTCPSAIDRTTIRSIVAHRRVRPIPGSKGRPSRIS